MRGSTRCRASAASFFVTLVALSAFGAILAWAPDASAQNCSDPLVSTCINSESYWPHAGPQRFAAVGSTETVAAGQVAFGLVGSYLSRPVILQVASPGPGGSEQLVVDNQVNGNFLFAYGVTDRLQLDFALPVTFVQDGSGTSPLTGGRSLRDTAVRDLRFGAAYAIVPRQRVDPTVRSKESSGWGSWALAARMTMSAPTGDQNDFAGERAAVFVPSLAADYRIDRLFFGVEVGARLRPVTEFAGARVGTQVTTAAGVGFDVLPRELLAILLEGRAYFQTVEQHDTQQSAFGTKSIPNGEHITPAEWMLGARSAPILGGDVSFYVGGGGPMPFVDPAITMPRFRFVLGASYAPVQHDTDGDGVPDRIDRCPTQIGEKSGDRPGCPAGDKKEPEPKP